MVLTWLRNVLTRPSQSARRPHAARQPSRGGRFRPRMEALEDRVLLDADLLVTKAGLPPAAVPGQAVTYNISVTNAPPSSGTHTTATNTQLVDTLPAGTTFLAATTSQGTCSQTAADTVTCNLGNLPANATATATVQVMVNTQLPGTLTNTVVGTTTTNDPDPVNNTGTATTTVNATPGTAADLSLTNAAAPGTVPVGQAITYQWTVTNNAATNVATNVQLFDALSPGLTLVSVAAPSGVTCAAPTAGGTSVVCNLGTLDPGESAQVAVTVLPTQAGTVTSMGTTTTDAGDVNTTNNTATLTTTVTAAGPTAANLVLDKTGPTGAVVPGQAVTYTLAVSNTSANPAPNTTLFDQLPPNFNLIASSTTAGACTSANGVVTCQLGTLPASGTATVTLTGTFTATGTLQNSAAVSTTAGDSDTTNNTDAVSTTVNAAGNPVDLSITKTGPASSVVPGQAAPYTITVTNNSTTSAATQTVVFDTLPANSSFVSASGPSGVTASFANGVVTYNLGTVNPNSSVTLNLILSPNTPPSANITNSATVTTASGETNPANNTATTTTPVAAVPPTAAELTVTKAGPAGTVMPGGTMTYTITVANTSGNPAANTVLTDDLPDNVSVQSFTSTVGTCSQQGGFVTCNLGTLAGGGTATVTINAMPLGPGQFTNSAIATTDSGDSDTSNNSSSVTTTVTPFDPAADLSVAKAESADPVVPGQALTYTILVNNNGPATATAATLTDTLPANVTFIGAAGPAGTSCGAAGSVVTCNLGDLPNQASVTVLVIVTPTPAAAGTTITNTATVTSTTGDNNPANNTASVTTTVNTPANPADLVLAVTDTPDPVFPGQQLTYAVTVTNNGPNPANAVTITDVLPSGVAFLSASGPAGSQCSQGNGIVTCTLGTLANGVSATVLINVTPTATGTITNTAAATTSSGDTVQGNNLVSTTTVVNPAPSGTDLVVTKADNPDPVSPGQQLTYTLTVTNNGPVAATNTVLTDNLPAGVTFLSATAPSGVTCSTANNSVTCTLGSVNVGASVQVTLLVTPDVTGTLSNTATATTSVGETNPGNNTVTITTTSQAAPSPADLVVVMTDNPDPVVPGQLLTYTISVTNNGSNPANNTVLTDTLPSGVNLISASGPSGSTCSQTGNTVSCTLGTLAAGASATVTLLVTPTAVGTITNTATATTASGDANPGNNTDSESTTVQAAANPADLAVTKTANPSSVFPGQVLTYTVTVTNNGPSTATATTLVDVLPPGVVFLSATSPAGTSCVQSSGVVNCSLGNLGAGVSSQVTINVTPLQPGSITNTATATTSAGESNPGNNSASVTTTVNATPSGTGTDLAVTKSANPSPVAPGQTLTYTITVNNAGPNLATNVQVFDTLPGGVTFLSATGPSGSICSQAGGVVTCTLGSLANGASAVVTITVTPNATGTITNTVTATTSVGDTNPGNNTATVNTPVQASPNATDLAITKSANPSPGTVGQNLVYTITVTNNGPNTATATVVTDTLPAGVTFVSVAGPSGSSCSQAGGTVQCNLGNLGNGASAAITITVTPTATGSLSNTATVTTTAGETNPNNNTVTIATTVNDPSGQATTTTLIVSPNPAQFGQIVTFEATVSANTPGAPVPTGTVTFFDGFVQIGSASVDSSGRAVFGTSGLQAGQHSISAVYSGSANFAPSSSPPVALTVTPIPPAAQCTPNQCWVAQVYLDLLGRPVDAAGLAFWTSALAQGATRTQVALAIESSPEYRTLAISDLYLELLNRPVDPLGLQYSLNFLAQGGTLEQLEAIILSSPEYFSTQGGGTNAGWIAAVYLDVLQRPIQPNETAFWVGVLNQPGISLLAVATFVLVSPEADTVTIRNTYLQYLRRDALAQDLNFWLPALQAGMTNEVFVANVIGSPEYYGLVTTNLFQRYVTQVYNDLLNRTPAPSELAFWVGPLSIGLMTPVQFTSQVTISPEFRTDFIQSQYQQYLNRPADPAGLNAFLAFMGTGATFEQVDIILTSSQEYFVSQGGGTNQGFVQALWQDALGQPVDAVTLATLTQQLNSGVTSRQNVATLVFLSNAYKAVLIQDFYQSLLDRAASTAEVAAWTNFLSSPGARDEQMIAALASSDEYFADLA